MNHRVYFQRLTRAASYIAEQLEENGKPVITPFDFFQIVWRMYRESSGKKLYLRSDTPNRSNYLYLKASLRHAGLIRQDRDYGDRAIRVLNIPDLRADDITCMVDPTCYISHLSAMQRWGLTDRSPNALILTRPDRKTAAERLLAYRTEVLGKDNTDAFPLAIVRHPSRVRGRTIRTYESKTAGVFLRSRGSDARLSTIGQTFLDMLQKSHLCGGMPHVLEAWEEHAETHLDDIVQAVDAAKGGLVKSRAGYILEERLGLCRHRIEHWQAFGQRGSSRKLDPSKDFAPVRQANWQGYSGWKSRNMKQEPSTYFREPCAVTREGGREVSVAAHMARDIEQRKMCRSGRRDYRCGRRQYVRHRYGERADRPAVSKTPWTYVHILPGPGRSFQRPAPRAGPPKRRRNADRRMYVEERSDAMIVVMKLANKAWKTMWRSWWSEASHPRGNRSSRHALDAEPGSYATWHALDTEPGSCARGRCGYGNGPVRWSVNVMRGGATQGKSRMR